MLLDDQLMISRRESHTNQNIDWVFSLTGFIFFIVTIGIGFFFPLEPLGFYIFDNFYLMPLHELILFIGCVFFLLGGAYGLINRVFHWPTDYKLGVTHYGMTLISVIFILMKLSTQNELLYLSTSFFSSIFSLLALFVLAQVLFFCNLILALIRTIIWS